MGRKYVTKGKYVFLCLAGLIFLLHSGCAVFKELDKRQNTKRHLQQGRMLAADGNFPEAIRENQKVLMFASGRPADEALFNIGLIYVRQDNPDKNYKEAGSYFKQVIEKYPDSPLAEQSKVWITVLRELEKPVIKIVEKRAVRTAVKPDTDENLLLGQKLLAEGDFSGALQENLKIMETSHKNRFKAEALFNIALIYAHYENPDKDYMKSVEHFEQLIKEYPGSPLVQQAKIWLDVLNVIEKAKQVDIEIEQKKKELKR